MTLSPKIVRIALVAVAATLTLSACERPGTTESASSATPSTSAAQVQAPNAPATELTRTGWHCFDSPAAAAAAQARAQIAADRRNADVKTEADRTGSLLPYGWPSKVGDLNGTLCYQVTDSGIR